MPICNARTIEPSRVTLLLTIHHISRPARSRRLRPADAACWRGAGVSWRVRGRRWPRGAAWAVAGVWTLGSYAALQAAFRGSAPDPENAGLRPGAQRASI